MESTSHVSPLKRWLESLFVWYMLFMIAYLLLRFIVPIDWRLVDFLNNLAPYLFIPILIGLLITLLLRSQRLIGVYALVTLVGALWILPPLIPASSPSDAEGTVFDIISFNFFPDNTRPDDAVEWISAYAPDIIALQELPTDISMLEPFELAYPYSAVDSERAESAIYSQYPIIESEIIDLALSPVQRLVLDVNGQAVAVYNVHVFMPLNDREADWTILRYDEARRDADLDALLARINEELLPVILIGDLNMTEWSPKYHAFAELLNDAYRTSSWGIGATWPASASEDFAGGYPRLFRIDYVWTSESIEAVSAFVGSNLGSDHLPLRVELVLP